MAKDSDCVIRHANNVGVHSLITVKVKLPIKKINWKLCNFERGFRDGSRTRLLQPELLLLQLNITKLDTGPEINTTFKFQNNGQDTDSIDRTDYNEIDDTGYWNNNVSTLVPL